MSELSEFERVLLEAELAAADAAHEAKTRVLRERLGESREPSPAPSAPARSRRAPVRRSMLKPPETKPSDTTLKKAARVIERNGGSVT